MAVSPTTSLPRNPGPSWGFRFLQTLDRALPEVIFRPLRALGTWIAVAALSERRYHSREYLACVLPKPPTLRDVFQHFFAFEESLMLRLRVARGRPHRAVMAPGAEGFLAQVESGEPALLGTFHVGDSDLMGYLFGPRSRGRVFMVRQRVGNSGDTESLGRRFSDSLTYVWVNDPEEILFALKDAVAAGGSIALQCDRMEFTSKVEAFDFLGARRQFPFTIYHLALIFQMPVFISVGIPHAPGVSALHSSDRWAPEPTRSRAENLDGARDHFQRCLRQLESLLAAHPYLWFNFLPLNPLARETPVPAGVPSR